MDHVPYEFCQSVAESLGHTYVSPRFVSPIWTKAFHDFQTRRSAFICHLSDVNGTWRYAFQCVGSPQNSESSYRLLEQIVALPHLRQMRIREISISRPSDTLFNVLIPFFWLLEVEVARFLQFVLFYSSERFTTLSLKGIFHEIDDSDLMETLQDHNFPRIIIWNYRSLHNELLRRHLPQNEFTQLDLRSDQWPQGILDELRAHVLSQHFYSMLLNENEEVEFKFDVFESIFQKFLQGRWKKKLIILRAIFEREAVNLLKAYRVDLTVLCDDESCFRWSCSDYVLVVQVLSSYGLWEVKHE